MSYLNENFDFSKFQDSTYFELCFCELKIKRDGSLKSFDVTSRNADEIVEELERTFIDIPNWNPAIRGKRMKRSVLSLSVTVIITDTLKQVFVGLEKDSVKIKVGDELWLFIEQNPMFIGGLDSMYSYLGRELVYPEDARALAIQGTVYIKFIIEKNGDVSTAILERGVWPSLDEEALCVIRMMPKWSPGMQNGKFVRCYFTIPIKFVLQDDDKP